MIHKLFTNYPEIVFKYYSKITLHIQNSAHVTPLLSEQNRWKTSTVLQIEVNRRFDNARYHIKRQRLKDWKASHVFLCIESKRHRACLVIQRRWKGKQCRRGYAQLLARIRTAAIAIQSVWRGSQERVRYADACHFVHQRRIVVAKFFHAQKQQTCQELVTNHRATGLYLLNFWNMLNFVG